MCPSICGDSDPMSLPFSFDFPGQLKNWLRWCTTGERGTKGETCADQMTDSFQALKNVMQFLSQARVMRSALVYCLQRGVTHNESGAQRTCVFESLKRDVTELRTAYDGRQSDSAAREQLRTLWEL